MHLEILVEDASGRRALEHLLPGIVGPGHTFSIHAYKGIGRIPPNMKDARDASKRILLDNLPKLLKGFGRTLPAPAILAADLAKPTPTSP
jgi:hypothetical protein